MSPLPRSCGKGGGSRGQAPASLCAPAPRCRTCEETGNKETQQVSAQGLTPKTSLETPHSHRTGSPSESLSSERSQIPNRGTQAPNPHFPQGQRQAEDQGHRCTHPQSRGSYGGLSSPRTPLGHPVGATRESLAQITEAQGPSSSCKKKTGDQWTARALTVTGRGRMPTNGGGSLGAGPAPFLSPLHAQVLLRTLELAQLPPSRPVGARSHHAWRSGPGFPQTAGPDP